MQDKKFNLCHHYESNDKNNNNNSNKKWTNIKNVLRKGLAESSIALSSSPGCLLKLKEVQI